MDTPRAPLDQPAPAEDTNTTRQFSQVSRILQGNAKLGEGHAIRLGLTACAATASGLGIAWRASKGTFVLGAAMYDLLGLLDDWLGLSRESHDLTVWLIGARAVIVYLAVLIVVRLGHKRFLSRSTPFDVILAILLGSVASRAITGNAPFFPTLFACAVLIALHALFAWGAFHWHGFGFLVKGKPTVLIRDGTLVTENMRESHITEHDIAEALRVEGGVNDAIRVKLAHLERNGEISVVLKPSADEAD